MEIAMNHRFTNTDLRSFALIVDPIDGAARF